jgi:hypothetical protein
MHKCIFLAIITLFLFSCSFKKANQTDFEFLTLGLPEHINSLDTNELGAKFYLKSMFDNDSILVKINEDQDDVETFLNNKPNYYILSKDSILDSLVLLIEFYYKDTLNGTLKSSIPDSSALYCGGSHFFRFIDATGQERYFNYMSTSSNELLNTFHYFIIEKYYHKKFVGKVTPIYVNTDSIALAYTKRQNIYLQRDPPVVKDVIRFVPPKK